MTIVSDDWSDVVCRLSILRESQHPGRYDAMPDMSLFPSKDTKLELYLRRHLFARGIRYRLHDRRLKGTPDLVFPKHQAVIFVHGCFWHAHAGCLGFRLPKSNRKFWVAKFRRNRERDRRACIWLEEHGWRVLTVWECALRRPVCFTFDELLDFVSCWLAGGCHSCEIRGGEPLPSLVMDIDLRQCRKL